MAGDWKDQKRTLQHPPGKQVEDHSWGAFEGGFWHHFSPHFSGHLSSILLEANVPVVFFMVGKMVQNSQNSYSFTFTAVIVIHEYIYSHATTKFTFKKYICLHLTTSFLFTKSIYLLTFTDASFTFNSLYLFTFTIQILIQQGAIFIRHFLHTPFALCNFV